MTKVIDFMVGTDPEFSCEYNGTLVPSRNVIRRDTGLEFGNDANGVTYEVRPAPAKNPLQVVNNIRDIFIRQTLDNPKFLKYDWVAGTWHRGYPLGGHVHFGIGKTVIRHDTATRFLDNYVGLISLLLENKAHGIKRREDGHYGFMGDHRPQEWGFEYRPMSSWLTSPYVTAAIMCLSKTVMFEVLNNNKFNWNEYAKPEDFKTMNQERILTKFPEIWKDITKMQLYQIYKPYIDMLYFLVKNKLTWFPRASMKESWAVFDMSPCLGNKISVDVLWNRYNTQQ